ncbi:MAG: hypothetical protein K6U80_18300 [Firmicutes bacterium]|nr:hypothetical protein [Bacillota bacterium]
MGRQINFFMTEQDERRFIEEFIKVNDLLMLKMLTNDGKIEYINYEDKIEDLQLYIAAKHSKIIVSPIGVVDSSSEVIEFSRSWPEKEKILRSGRLWVNSQYWTKDGVLTKQPEWLMQIFNKAVKWIKKNYRRSKDEHYYIGEDAYRLYAQEGWIMSTGPMDRTEF